MKVLVVFVVLCLVKSGLAQIACTTPNGEPARCIPIKQCQVIKDAFKNGRPSPDVANFIRESNCGFSNGPWVCCGSVHRYVATSTPQIAPLKVPETDPNADPKQHRNYNLLPSKCGVHELDDRILGGVEADIEEFPWMVLIEYKDKRGKSVGFSCGGILISSRYVLTAAHCVTGAVLQAVGTPFSIRVGEHDLTTEKDCRTKTEGTITYEVCSAPYQDAEIEKITPHASYNLDGQEHNDIGLLRLKNPVEITSSVRPICLPLNGERSAVGKRLFVAGWGNTKIDNRIVSSQVKLKVSVPMVTNNQCNNLYLPRRRSITDNQFCAGGEPDVDSCRGDSGGPIMNSKGIGWYVEGIVSWGPNPCGTPGYPGVYTKVAAYNNWILDNMA